MCIVFILYVSFYFQFYIIITNRPAVRLVELTTVANLVLPVVGPRTWNDLPDDVTSVESLSIFRQRLKTHLFAFTKLYSP